MTPRIFDDVVVAQLGPLPITETMTTTLIVSASLVLSACLLTRAARLRPRSRVAALARITYGALDALVVQAAGKRDPLLMDLAATLFAFIAACAIIEQLPAVHAPTANLATTSALAVAVFVSVPVFGILRTGLGTYLREYFEPTPLLMPIHVVSEISRTLALALRLFGNMMSGHLLIALIVALVGVILPLPLMVLDLMIGLLQAYIFTVLACVYVGAALRSSNDQEPAGSPRGGAT